MFASQQIPVFSLGEQDLSRDSFVVGTRKFNKQVFLRNHGHGTHPDLHRQEKFIVNGIENIPSRKPVKLNEPRTIEKHQRISLSHRHHKQRMIVMDPSIAVREKTTRENIIKKKMILTTPKEESLRLANPNIPLTTPTKKPLGTVPIMTDKGVVDIPATKKNIILSQIV